MENKFLKLKVIIKLYVIFLDSCDFFVHLANYSTLFLLYNIFL